MYNSLIGYYCLQLLTTLFAFIPCSSNLLYLWRLFFPCPSDDCYSIHKGYRNRNTKVTRLQVVSSSQCRLSCSSYSTCVAFDYNVKTGSCLMYPARHRLNIKEDSCCEHWVKRTCSGGFLDHIWHVKHEYKYTRWCHYVFRIASRLCGWSPMVFLKKGMYFLCFRLF